MQAEPSPRGWRFTMLDQTGNPSPAAAWNNGG
jgi:hypothetical protein